MMIKVMYKWSKPYLSDVKEVIKSIKNNLPSGIRYIAFDKFEIADVKSKESILAEYSTSYDKKCFEYYLKCDRKDYFLMDVILYDYGFVPKIM